MIPYNDTFCRYLKPLSNGNEDEDQALGAKMLYSSMQVNQLKEQVEEQHLDRRSVCWKEVSEVVDFPQLDEEGLQKLTCGSYQLRLSFSYAQEHIEGDCAIHMHKGIPMQSRHTSYKIYQLWIKYEDGDIIVSIASVGLVRELIVCALIEYTLIGILGLHDTGVMLVVLEYVTGKSFLRMPQQ